MGYYSRLDGRITITPPLNWAEVRDSGLAGDDIDSPFRIEEDVETTETDEGITTIRRGVALIPAREDEGKYYALEDDLRRIVTALPDRTFSGYFVRSGEEQGDVERHSVRDGRVITEKASLRWPDGSEVDL